jgi:hypothetical protein
LLCEICPSQLVPYVQREAVFRWASCSPTFGSLKTWLIDCLIPWFEVLTLDGITNILLDEMNTENESRAPEDKLEPQEILEKAEGETEVLLLDLFGISCNFYNTQQFEILESLTAVWPGLILGNTQDGNIHPEDQEIHSVNIKTILQFLVEQTVVEASSQGDSILEVSKAVTLSIFKLSSTVVLQSLLQYLDVENASVNPDDPAFSKIISRIGTRLKKKRSNVKRKSTSLIPMLSKAYSSNYLKKDHQSQTKRLLQLKSDDSNPSPPPSALQSIPHLAKKIHSTTAALLVPLMGFRFSACASAVPEIVTQLLLILDHSDFHLVALLSQIIRSLCSDNSVIYDLVIKVCEKLENGDYSFRWRHQIATYNPPPVEKIFQTALASDKILLEDLVFVIQSWLDESDRRLLIQFVTSIVKRLNGTNHSQTVRSLKMYTVVICSNSSLLNERDESFIRLTNVTRTIAKLVTKSMYTGLTDWELDIHRDKLSADSHPQVSCISEEGQRALELCERSIETLDCLCAEANKVSFIWDLNNFTGHSLFFWLALSLVRMSISPIFLKSLKLLKTVLCNSNFVRFLKSFGLSSLEEALTTQAISNMKPGVSDVDKFLSKTLKFKFWTCGRTWRPPFTGIQSPLFDGILLNLHQSFTDSSWMLQCMWRISASGLVDRDPTWALDNLVLILPWLHFHIVETNDQVQADVAVTVNPLLYCQQLSDEISRTGFRDTDKLKLALSFCASCENTSEAANALESLIEELVRAYFPNGARKCAQHLERFFFLAPPCYQPSVLYVTSLFLSQGCSTKDTLSCFDRLIRISAKCLAHTGKIYSAALSLITTSLKTFKRIEDGDEKSFIIPPPPPSGLIIPPPPPADENQDFDVDYLEMSLSSIERVLRNPLFEDDGGIDEKEEPNVAASPSASFKPAGFKINISSAEEKEPRRLEQKSPSKKQEVFISDDDIDPSNNAGMEQVYLEEMAQLRTNLNRTMDLTTLLTPAIPPANLSTILSEEPVQQEFIKFLEANKDKFGSFLSSIAFYNEVQSFERSPLSEDAQIICQRFIEISSPECVLLEAPIRTEIIQQVENSSELPSSLFGKAMYEITSKLSQVVLPHFWTSEEFNELVKRNLISPFSTPQENKD